MKSERETVLENGNEITSYTWYWTQPTKIKEQNTGENNGNHEKKHGGMHELRVLAEMYILM
jgi:hypothetical protein